MVLVQLFDIFYLCSCLHLNISYFFLSIFQILNTHTFYCKLSHIFFGTQRLHIINKIYPGIEVGPSLLKSALQDSQILRLGEELGSEQSAGLASWCSLLAILSLCLGLQAKLCELIHLFMLLCIFCCCFQGTVLFEILQPCLS